MGEQGRDDGIAAHIASLAARTPREADRLVGALMGRAWPGGNADRSEPGALEWVRRWRPLGSPVTRAVCACATGRCLVCN